VKRFLSIVVFLAVPASMVQSGDLTTITSPGARYFVNLGKSWGDTVPVVPGGIYELASGPGNASPWWRINDGTATGHANTFGETGDESIGYRFKTQAIIHSIVFTDYVDADGGTFTAAPAVAVLVGGAWYKVVASWSPAYDSTFDVGMHQYTITPSAPLANIDGVMLANSATPGTGDGDGYIGVTELKLIGRMLLPRPVDLTVDLTGAAGTTAFSTHSQYDLSSLIDDDLTTYDTTVLAGQDLVNHGRYDQMGVMFATPQSHVTAFGIVLKFFSDGGWLDEDHDPFTIEYTTNNGASWIPVTGLDKGTYADDYAGLELSTYPLETGFLFTFDPISIPIDGIRIWGDGGGTADPYSFPDSEGFLAATEIEVFTDGFLFADGFEVGNTSDWTTSVP
jgi:hypothetical protein